MRPTQTKKKRYKRIQGRRSESDKVSFEEFVKAEAAELDDPRPFGAKKLKVIAMADHIIVNNGAVEELNSHIEKTLVALS